MRILPAIDIKDGKCVRLAKGDYSKVTHYFDNPLDVAQVWLSKGATSIHIVDLDGARDGETTNFEIIKKIRSKYPDIYIQVGGGIRSNTIIQKYFKIGINKLIIGTKALSEPKFLTSIPSVHRKNIIIDLAVKNMKLVVQGWESETDYSVEDYLQILQENDISEIVYTDVDKDGMLDGMNFDEIKKLLRITDIPIIASGGVTSINDIKELNAFSQNGISGVIIGKALYEKKIDLHDVLKITGK
jgi:phosphoribosylformimino-5-aminoimidazole carboxamide ribotide isomerase